VTGNAEAPQARGGSRDVLFWVIYYLPFATVVLRLLLGTIPDFGFNPVVAMLLGAFLVLAACQPVVVARSPVLLQPLLALQTLLIAALIFTPPLADYHALLIVSVSLVATRYLPSNRDVPWLVACCAVPSAALVGAFGLEEGLQYVPAYVAAVLCLGLYGRAGRKAEEARSRSDELLVELRAATEQAEELAALHERARLARELHDAVTQTIFGVTLTAEAARIAAAQDPALVPPLLDRIQESSADALAELKAIVAELRPRRVAEEGLVSSLRRHLALRQRREGLQVELSVEGEEWGEPAAREALFRAVQEALNNVAKHAGVRSASVELRFGETEIAVAVRDAGRGFDSGAGTKGSGFGLAGMRERIEGLGGTVRIDSRPGAGTEVRMRVPARPGGEDSGEG
jgi:signal transduction histidine kinase